MAQLRQLSNRLRWVRDLFLLNAALWLVIGGISLVRIAHNTTLPIAALCMIVVLMLGNAGVMIFCGWKMVKRPQRYYYFAVAVVVVNLILTVTDEFGIFDLIVLISNSVLLISLLAVRPRQRMSSAGGTDSTG